MRPIFVGIVLAFSVTMSAGFAHAQPKPKVPEDKIGEVIIVGNTITQDRVIREVLNLHPGQTLRYPDLPVAERNLARLGLFKLDIKKGIRPTVMVLNSPGQFKDILVKVVEGPTSTFRPLVQITPKSGLVLGFVIEERNFDPLGFPTSVTDINEGKAFRGAGQKWRLEFGMAPFLPSTFFLSVTARLTPLADGLELLSWRP